ncbi:hypothetical protein OG871_39815 (plasmid) [Kitasatospora sp. NBC_00374]|uniref:hypothetical protein n=1 Tax=Kitasatospora sp. NBC_00374 TaxID=2975964 RepID=UPI002F906DFB
MTTIVAGQDPLPAEGPRPTGPGHRHTMIDIFQDWPADKPVNTAWLEAAESGTLRYDRDRYPIHAVPNNVVYLIWGGLLTDGPDGPELTDAGRTRLAHERTLRPPAAPEQPDSPAGAAPAPEPAIQPQPPADQLTLFG